jgi:lysophospholipase L1-like esterase
MGRNCAALAVERIGLFFVCIGAACVAQAAPVSAFELLESFDSLNVMVLGDSMAAGALADTTLGQELDARQISRLESAQTLHLSYPKSSLEYRSALQKLSASLEFNAIESRQPWSLSQHLRDHFAQSGRDRVRVVNRAIIGATSESLFEQIHSYRSSYQRGEDKANVVIVNVGGNDWCSDAVTPDVFAQNMEFRLYQITKDHPNALVLVNGLPPVDETFQIRDAVAFTARGYTVMCQDIEPLLEDECPVGVRMRRNADPALDQQLRLRRQDMSRRLERVVNRMSSGAGSYPVYQGRLIYVGLDQLSVGIEHIAADCFHPGREGHYLWSEAMWQAILRN